MCVKYLQKLNIRSDYGNKVAPVSALQLCGAELAQGVKHLLAYQCKQLERYKMIAGLLGIAKPASASTEIPVVSSVALRAGD